jgi:hypothetical protein
MLINLLALSCQKVDLSDPKDKQAFTEMLKRDSPMRGNSVPLTFEEFVQSSDIFKDGEIYHTGLWFTLYSYERGKVLRPRRGEVQPRFYPVVKITLHAIQRYFQRGYELTDNGEITYRQLVEGLQMACYEAFGEMLDDLDLKSYTLSYKEIQFVFKREEKNPLDGEGEAIALVTILPGKKNALGHQDDELALEEEKETGQAMAG